MKSNNIVGAGNKEARRPMDFYPTPTECTVALIDTLEKHRLLHTGHVVWEPACGDGAISKCLEARGYTVRSTDIRKDSGYGLGGIDFLQTDGHTDVDWVITNPPFNVSEAFIEKCFSLNIPFALLLKERYWHSKKRHGLFYKRKPSAVMPLTWRPNFTGQGSSLMDMQWTVWATYDCDYTVYMPLMKGGGTDG